MKKLFSVLTIMVIITSVTACSNNTTANKAESVESSIPAQSSETEVENDKSSIATSVSEESSKSQIPDVEYGELEWVSHKLAPLIPVPKSTKGEVVFEMTAGFNVNVGNTSHSDYSDYVNECLKLGFDFEYNKTENECYMKNKDGNLLTIIYKEGSVMEINLADGV